jgi:protein-disulfide isomerase
VIAVVSITVGVIVIARSASSDKQSTSSGTTASRAVEVKEAITDVYPLLAGIPQHRNVLGYPNAPITLQYFGDLECTACKEFTLSALPAIISRWVRAGKLRIEYRAIESATQERKVFEVQQVAAYDAGIQNLAWYFIELFYHEQGEEGSGYVTPSYIEELANQIPRLNRSQWFKDAKDPAFVSELISDNKAAGHAGLRRTPSFLIGKTGGSSTKLEDGVVTDPAPFNEAIEQLLAS